MSADTAAPSPRAKPDMSQARYAPIPLEQLREMSGIELFEGLISGSLPGAPIAKLMNMWVQEAEPGRVLFGGEPGLEHYNPIGSVHGGYAGTMLDSCMSCAVQSMLPKGMGYTTLEYKVSLVRGITHKTGVVWAEGRAIQVGNRVGTAEGRITDSSGRILATGTTTCLVFPI